MAEKASNKKTAGASNPAPAAQDKFLKAENPTSHPEPASTRQMAENPASHLGSANNLQPKEAHGSRSLYRYTLFWTFCTLAAVPLACIHNQDAHLLLEDFVRILTSPSKLVTDYFALGGLGAAFLNAGLCTLLCDILIRLTRAKMTETTLAAYFLVLAHCFYGLNLLNMAPCMAGVFVYCVATRRKIAFFSTALGPFASDFLFRYTLGAAFDPSHPKISAAGLIVTAIFSLASGFIVPALLPGTAKMHKGYNLYKAGLAIGLYGMFAFALFYKTLGVAMPEIIFHANPIYEAAERNYLKFINCYFIVIFGITLIYGLSSNARGKQGDSQNRSSRPGQNGCKKRHLSFSGYREIWLCDGHSDMFTSRFGFPLTLVNIGLYGLSIMLFLNAAMAATNGVGFTGPTTGVIIAAITFSASGQTPRNTWPVALGFILLSAVSQIVFRFTPLSSSWTLTTQVYINGLAFATGLCPFTGRYGRRYGVLAGMLDAALCSSTALFHGGFVLYNGGFTAGLTAMLLITILEFYNVKQITDSDHK